MMVARMKSPTLPLRARCALLASLAVPLAAPPAAADVLEVGAGARGWSPSFSFLAGRAPAPEPAAPRSTGSPAREDVALQAPVCSAATSDLCLTPHAAVTPDPSGMDAGAPGEATAAPPQLAALGTPGGVLGDASSAPVVDIEPPPPAPAPRTDEAATPRDETELWVPALSFYSGALIQDADSAIDSSPVLGPGAKLGCPDPLSNTCIRRPVSGDDRQVTPFVLASLELMTPGVQSWPGRPRAFVHADAGVTFGPRRNIAREGAPGEFVVTTPANFGPAAIFEGQGSQAQSFVKTLMLGAGAGVAFTADVGERRVRIKPSVEMLRETVQVDGELRRVIDLNPPFLCPENGGDRCRFITLADDDEKNYWGVGPGLEIEMDAARAGPMVFTLYTSGAAYKMLGDLDIRLSDTNEFGETAVWTYEKDEWTYRAGVGVRVRFAPED